MLHIAKRAAPKYRRRTVNIVLTGFHEKFSYSKPNSKHFIAQNCRKVSHIEQANQSKKKNLYLLPGTMCNERLWVKLSPYLDKRFNLIFLKIPSNKSFEEITSFYSNTIKEKNIHLAGFSLGGYIASYISLKNTNLVEKLFVISNSPTKLSKKELKNRHDTLNTIKKYGYRGISRKKAISYFDKYNHESDLIDLVIKMDNEQGEKELISQIMNTSERTDLTHELTHFSKRTHFYCSENDQLVNLKKLKDISRYNAKISVFSTSGTGHMLPLEKPKETSEQIIEWMENK